MVKGQLTSFFGSKPRALPHMPMSDLVGTHDVDYVKQLVMKDGQFPIFSKYL